MKKMILLATIVSAFVTLTAFNSENPIILTEESVLITNYHEGWNDGHCEGWKDEKGKYAYCPQPPYPPYPSYPKSVDSYRDGYNDGFKRGISDARR